MKTNTQIMHDAFNEVDDNFTSHEFYDVYRKNGGHDNQIHRGALRTFLYGVANPVQGSTKLWTKKNKSNNAKPKPEPIKEPNLFEKHFDQPLNYLTEQDCIKFLKSRGYTITKIVEF